MLGACSGGGSSDDGEQQVPASVSWSPQSVAIDLTAGAQDTVTVTLSSSGAISQGTLSLTGNIKDYVSVQSSIANLSPGNAQSIIIDVAPPLSVNVDQSYTGTLSLSTSVQTIEIPLDMTLNVAPRPTPPFIGVDADGDGIWDDVADGIDQLYPNSPDVVTVQRRGAKAMQETLSAGQSGDLTAVVDATNERAKWVTCLVQVGISQNLHGNFGEKEIAQLHSLILTTLERQQAYDQSEALLVGTVIPVPQISTEQCTTP